MPKILIVNPNTTAEMTRKVEATARAVAAPDTTVTATNPVDGPVSIEGFVDEAYAVPGLLDVLRQNQEFDGYVIACFDDTGLDAARCVVQAPVIGIGEAAFHYATFLTGKFSVVTTLSRSIAAIDHNLVRYGLSSRCASVRASDVPVLELENPESGAYEKIRAEAMRARDDDHCGAIVLGCAGMTDLVARLSADIGLPVLDGVSCSIKIAEGLASLNLQTSRIGSYAPPRAKPYLGRLADSSIG